MNNKTGIKWSIAALLAGCCLLGCAAGRDIRVDKVSLSGHYGQVKSHLPAFEGKFAYFRESGPSAYYTQQVTGSPDTAYTSMAQYTLQEDDTVMASVSVEQMIYHMCKMAWENGADAIVELKIDTVQLYGGRRTSPRVHGVAIRYDQ